MTTFFSATCPECGYLMDAHSAIGEEDATPSAGDFSVCIACGALCVYQPILGSLALRRPTPEEHESGMESPTLVAAMFAQRAARSRDASWPRGPKEST